MSRIDHNRPSLRYLDNLRRELSRVPLISQPAWALPQAPVRPAPTHQPQARPAASAAAYERHIQRFDALTQEQQQVLDHMINAYGALIDARLAELEVFLEPGKRRKERRAAREKAERVVSNACSAFHKQCRLEAAGGKSPTREWYRKLLTLLGPERTHWEELEIIIKETR